MKQVFFIKWSTYFISTENTLYTYNGSLQPYMREKAYPSLHGPVHSPLPHGLRILTNIASPTCGWTKQNLNIYIFEFHSIIRLISYTLASYTVINITFVKKKKRFRMSLTCLSPLHLCICLKPGFGCLWENIVGIFIFDGLRCKMVVRLFFFIGELVDHHY